MSNFDSFPVYGTFKEDCSFQENGSRSSIQHPTRGLHMQFLQKILLCTLTGMAVVGIHQFGISERVADSQFVIAGVSASVQDDNWNGTFDYHVGLGTVEASVYVDAYPAVKPPKLTVGRIDPEASAYGKFKDDLHTTGWSHIWVNATDRGYNNISAYERGLSSIYAAGYLEGALTRHRIYQHYYNMYTSFFGGDEMPDKVQEFLVSNWAYLKERVREHEADETKNGQYWRAVAGVVAQFEGLMDGYQAYAPSNETMKAVDFLFLTADGDMEDVVTAAGNMTIEEIDENSPTPYHLLRKGLRCSAFIKLLADKSDILFGHATWDQFNAMVRLFKHYSLPMVHERNPNSMLTQTTERRDVAYSASPGFLASVDDFYMLGNGLVVIETTNGVYNQELYQLVKPQSVLSWVRTTVANAMASDANEWADYFSIENSGTYNNQWMIVDTNKFLHGSGLQPGGFVLLEQIPGHFEREDMSDHLNNKGHFGSYNVPYFKTIYKESGFESKYINSNYSSDWSYWDCPRAKIFERNASAIHSVDDLKTMMRYNKWQEDPLSLEHPGNAIAARFDLDPHGKSLHGAIDAKVTNIVGARALTCEAVNGPTTEQPIFSWLENNNKGVPHLGQPVIFDFEYLSMQPTQW